MRAVLEEDAMAIWPEICSNMGAPQNAKNDGVQAVVSCSECY